MDADSPSASSSTCEELERKEQQQQQQPEQSQVKECLYKTKTIQFLGRTTPIILQNDNGPCPLLAICNILLLRNNLTINADNSEVSQERLLSLVAERLIDSNSDVNNKDAGYVENQQQNIADSIDLLPRLTTGIDVNIKFRRINDFEFTRECAIFDLLDIPLYHGWLVDPQDVETANAIGCKSYNALMSELVALETQNFGGQQQNISAEDSVDFAAATTAALGVPSPCLTQNRSFDDSTPSIVDFCNLRKGDLEEEAELMKALKLSEGETPTLKADIIVTNTNGGTALKTSGENQSSIENMLVDYKGAAEGSAITEIEGFNKPGNFIPDNHPISSNDDNKQIFSQLDGKEEASSTHIISVRDMTIHTDPFSLKESGELLSGDSGFEKSTKLILVNDETITETSEVEKSSVKSTISDNSFRMLANNEIGPTPEEFPAALNDKSFINDSQGDKEMDNKTDFRTTAMNEAAENLCAPDTVDVSSPSMPTAALGSNGKSKHDGSNVLTANIEGNEPIYEGEECIIDSGTTIREGGEPVYEGEAMLAENAEKIDVDSSKAMASKRLTPEEGELIRNFLKSTASQLTFYGLFCLQEGLKERELCVFFRNNHFSTMFKYDGELYLLATDQGYLNQPDLVWEKLNEVNGDTLFMTGNFKEFKLESNGNGTWDEHNAMTSTADYLASVNGTTQAGSDINSDLQLAIALQQQEFEQQPARDTTPQPSVVGASRLVTGPQAPRSSVRNTSSAVKPEGKSKEKCTVM